jgi:hypothetical protein
MGLDCADCYEAEKSKRFPNSRIFLERGTKDGDSPVSEIGKFFSGQVPKYHGTRETLWEFIKTT